MAINPSTFESHFDSDGNLVTDVAGADPDGIQTVAWRYLSDATGKGTNGSINGPYAQADGTAHIVVDAKHFPNQPGTATVTVSQTLGPPATVTA